MPVDIFHTDKYLPPNVEISLILRRFNTAFGVIQHVPGKTFHIRLKELKLGMRKVLPSVRVQNRLNPELLKGKPFLLPFKDTRMKYYLIPSVSTSFIANHINNSEMLPQQIIFCMVDSDLFSKQPSPYQTFFFKHAFLRSVILKKTTGNLLCPDRQWIPMILWNYTVIFKVMLVAEIAFRPKLLLAVRCFLRSIWLLINAYPFTTMRVRQEIWN